MPYQSLTESVFTDYTLDLVSTSSGNNVAELIDPSLLSLHATPQEPIRTTVNPADLSLRPVCVMSNPSNEYGSVAYEASNGSSTKRQTSLRRTLRGYSTESRINTLPSVPQEIVDRFWRVYNVIHNLPRPTPPEPRLFKAFFECDGQINRCLLCNYSIQNQTQMAQHVAGHHFDSFQYGCSVKGCSYSSARLADLKTHVREQHENSGVGHKCSMCEKTLKHKRNYVRHVKKHKDKDGSHPEVQNADGSQTTMPHIR